MSATALTCIVASDGRRGIENQALGLAEALGRRIPLEIVTEHLARPGMLSRFNAQSARADAAKPERFLWIGCGRAAAAAAAPLRRMRPEAALVYVQDPKRSYGAFDLIVAPSHDGLERDNVVSILGSPNRVSEDKLAKARSAFPHLSALRRPRAAVLIGGKSKRHDMTPVVSAGLFEQFKAMLASGWSLMITTSRRTPEDFTATMRAAFSGDPNVVFWSSEADGPNPYFGFLAYADIAIVTKDSTNMLTEAASAGLPVLYAEAAGEDGKFAQLYAALEARRCAQPFIGPVEPWPVEPLRETERAAEAVLDMLADKGLASRPA